MKIRRSIIALLAVGIIGALAIGASSASAATATSVPFRAFMPSGTTATLVGVPGAAAGANCNTSSQLFVGVTGTSPGGIIKTWYHDEGTGNNPQSFAFQDDVFNINEQAPLNDVGNPGREVSGTFEFSNEDANRQLTAQYSTEDGSDFQAGGPNADCAVWGSAVKVVG